MIETAVRRRHRQEFAERMQVEYAGALPPGQVVAAITRAEILLARSHRHPWSPDVQDLCETIVRHLLTRQLATYPVAHRA